MKHLSIAVAVVLTAGAPRIEAQPATPAPEPPADETAAADAAPEPNIHDLVAAALLARGRFLFDRGNYADAKKMFVEALERSPKGPDANTALTMLRATNEKLGVGDLDSGRPAGGDEKPIDPYGGPSGAGGESAKDPGASGGEAPLDPYAAAGDEAKALDPYSDRGAASAPAIPLPSPDPVIAPAPAVEADAPDVDEPNRTPSRGLMAWGAGYGFMLGMAIGGPTDPDTTDVRGGALLAGVAGLGVGLGGAYLASRRYPLSRGQVSAIASAGTWGMINSGLLGDVFTGDDTETNDVYKFIAAGGLLGGAAGAYYAIAKQPSEGDVAMVNSLAVYGTTVGLLFAVAIDPAQGEAYTLQAALGSLAGLTGGLILTPRFDMSRARTLRIDLGAAAGIAAPWVLLYPLIADDSSSSDEQLAGGISMLTMAGGIALTYYLTRNMDAANGGGSLAADPDAPPPGLLQRDRDGRWSLGAPTPRPVDNPVLGPRRGFSLGFDLASGRF